MFLDFYDKKNKHLGFMFISENFETFCHGENDKYIGKILESGRHIFVYDADEILIGRFDGTYTYDRNDRIICKGNYTYNLLYPTLVTIR